MIFSRIGTTIAKEKRVQRVVPSVYSYSSLVPVSFLRFTAHFIYRSIAASAAPALAFRTDPTTTAATAFLPTSPHNGAVMQPVYGATIHIGTVAISGMALSAVTGVVLSLALYIFGKFGLMNEKYDPMEQVKD